MSIIELLKIEFMKVKKVYDSAFAFNSTYLSCGFWCFQYQYVYDTRIYRLLGQQCSFKVHYFLDIIYFHFSMVIVCVMISNRETKE